MRASETLEFLSEKAGNQAHELDGRKDAPSVAGSMKEKNLRIKYYILDMRYYRNCSFPYPPLHLTIRAH